MLLQLGKKKKQQLVTAITSAEKSQGYLSAPTSPLLQYSRHHALTLRQSFEGIQVFGGTGSGKTSGSGAHIARSMLHAGFGGLVLCAKEEEMNVWIEHARAAGRENDLLRFGKDSAARFNFISYELAKGASPFDVAEVIENARDALDPAAGGAGGEGKYWRDAGKDVLVNAMILLYGSTGDCVLSELNRIIATAPQTSDEAMDSEWQLSSPMFAHYASAEDLNGKYIDPRDVDTAADYFIYQFARLGDRTRSSIVQNLMTTLNRFNYGMLRELFTEKTNLVPELCQEGSIIVVDLPAMKGDDNRIANHIWKYAFQRSASRNANKHSRPMFLWADESQYFLNEKDVLFQSTARSAAVSTVYLTQSIDMYKHAIGGTERAMTTTNAMLGNLRTHVFHANENVTTNHYAAEMIGKELVWRKNTSRGRNASKSKNQSWSSSSNKSLAIAKMRGGGFTSNEQGGSWSRNWSESETNSSSAGSTSGSGTGSTYGEAENFGESEQKDYRVEPDVFANQLRSGNVDDDFLVDAIVVSPEIPEPYLFVTFDQRHPSN